MSEPVMLTPVSPPMYLVPEEAGELLRLSAKSVYRLAKADPTFPVVRLGAGRNASIRIPRARLLAWLEERTQGHPLRRRMRASRNLASDHEVGRA